MKLYYTSPVKSNAENVRLFELVQKGASDTRVDLLSVYTKFLTLDDYRNLSDEEAYQIFRDSEKALKDADMLIANITTPSNRIGFEIATALANKKPVLAIVDTRENNKLSPPVQGNKSKYLTVLQYDDEAVLVQGIKDFIMESKKKVDTKFILIISPQIDKYLEWVAQERRMHKAQVVRESVEGTLGKDKEYQTFLRQQEE